MQIEQGVVIRCPIDQVFAVAANPDNDMRWGSLIIASRRLSEDPIGVGSRFEQTASFLGARLSTTLHITAYEPDRLMCYQAPQPVHLMHCRRFHEVPDGTEVTFSIEAEVEGRFKLAGSMLRRVSQRQIESDLDSLKALLESASSGAVV